MEGVPKPDNLDQHATAEDAAKHLISTNHPYASQVISHFQNTVNENNGASGQGTLLGNRPDSHIVWSGLEYTVLPQKEIDKILIMQFLYLTDPLLGAALSMDSRCRRSI